MFRTYYLNHTHKTEQSRNPAPLYLLVKRSYEVRDLEAKPNTLIHHQSTCGGGDACDGHASSPHRQSHYPAKPITYNSHYFLSKQAVREKNMLQQQQQQQKWHPLVIYTLIERYINMQFTHNSIRQDADMREAKQANGIIRVVMVYSQ